MNPQEQLAQLIESEEFLSLSDKDQAEVLRRMETDLGLMGKEQPQETPQDIGPFSEMVAASGVPIPGYDPVSQVDPMAGVKIGLKAIPPLLATAGAIGGGAVGAPAGPLGMWAGGTTGAAAGGGLGRLGENLLAQRLGFQQEQPLDANLTDARNEAIAQGVFQAVPFGKILAPFKGALKGEGKMLYDAALNMNLPMRPSTMTGSRAGRIIEWLAGESLPTGKAVTNWSTDVLEKRILDERKNLLQTVTGKDLGGMTFREGGQEVRQGLKETAEQQYKTLVERGGGRDKTIKVEETIAYLNDIKDSAFVQKNEALKNAIGRFIDNAKNGSITLQELNIFQKKINPLTYGKNNTLGKEIWKNLDSDLKLWDKEMGEGMYEVIKGTKKTWQDLARFEYIHDLLKKATRLKDGQEILNADRFYGEVTKDKTKKYIIDNFGEEQYKNIFTFATVAKAAAFERKRSTMSELEKGWQTVAGGGGVLAPLYNPALILPYGASPIIANSMMKPHGVFKKWLTTGLVTDAADVLMMGSRAAISGLNE